MPTRSSSAVRPRSLPPLIAAAPALRVIARAGTGVDNVDVAAASARGIVVMNAPGANSVSVAELAIGFVLALARHLPAADAAMKRGQVGKEEVSRRRGSRQDARPGRASDASVRKWRDGRRRSACASSRTIRSSPNRWPPASAWSWCRLDELFSRSNYLSLHMPSTPQTRQLVNATRLAAAKPGIRIINTARGDLVDEAALADAIEAGRVGRRRPSTSFTRNPPSISGCRCCRRSSRHPTSPRLPAKARNWLAWKRRQRCVTFSRTASSATRSTPVGVAGGILSDFDRSWHLAERLGTFIAQMNDHRASSVSVRYYGRTGRRPDRPAAERRARRACSSRFSHQPSRW